MPTHGNRDDENSSENTSNPALSRRSYFQALAAAGGTGLLAGCGAGGGDGNGGDGDGGGGDGSGGEFCETTFSTGGVVNVPPVDINFNLYAIQNAAQGLEASPLAKYDLITQKFVSENITGLAAQDSWEVNNEEGKASYKLREGIPWQAADNKEVTAEDAVTTFKLDKHLFGTGSDVWKFAESVQKTGDYAFEFSLKGHTDPFIFNFAVLNGRNIAPKHVYEEWLTKFEDASTDDETQTVKNELIQVKFTETPPPIGNSPWRPTELTPSFIKYRLRDKHPDSESLNFSTVRGYTWDDVNQSAIQMLQNGELDSAWVPLDEESRQQLPENIETQDHAKPQFLALMMNQDRMFEKRKVRQAIAYLIQQKKTAENIFPPNPIVPEFTGVPTPSTQDFWLKDIRDKLRDYAPEGDEEKAAQLLKEAGWSKEGGTWMQENGKPMQFEIIAPPAVPLNRMASLVSPQFKSFGFKVNVKEQPGKKMWSDVFPAGKYDVTPAPYGADNGHPYLFYPRIFSNKKSEAPTAHFPEEVSVPMPIGDYEGSEETFKPVEMANSIPTKSREEAVKTVQKLAWIFNVTVPAVPIIIKINNISYDVGNWNVKSKDTPGMGIVQMQGNVPGKGLITAKEDGCNNAQST